MPLLPGIFIYAVAFGVLSRDIQLDAAQAALMSLFVYSGTAQLAALALLGAKAGTLAVLAAVVIVNSRYLLYGAAMRPWLGSLKPLPAYGTLFFMGDGNWILSMDAKEKGELDAGYVFGSGSIMAFPWVGGTVVGNLSGHLMSDPARFGFDFFLVAFSTALAAGMTKARGDLWMVAIAAIVALIAHRVLPPGWTPVVAGVAGGIAGWIRFNDQH